MTAEQRLRRLEGRDNGACPKCGHVAGECLSAEQIAEVDAALKEAIGEMEEVVRGSE